MGATPSHGLYTSKTLPKSVTTSHFDACILAAYEILLARGQWMRLVGSMTCSRKSHVASGEKEMGAEQVAVAAKASIQGRHEVIDLTKD